MPRKKNKRSKNRKPSDLASAEASAKKLQSLLTYPELWGYMRSGTMRGVREKILKLDFQTTRNVVDRVPLVTAIVNARSDQVRKYAEYTVEKGETGFEFYWADPNKEIAEKDYKLFYQLADFLAQTGIMYDSNREDDFADYLDMLVRETLTIDQVSTELQRNRKSEVIAFWALDSATIKRIDPEEFNANFPQGLSSDSVIRKVTKDTKFVQVVEDKITNSYTDEDMIFDYKYKRADLRFRGFGYSPVEQCIDMITTLLFGYNYLRDQLMRDRVPKGFIQVMGDVGRDQLDAIREYWYSAMSGAGGVWSIPIVPSGKDGIGIDWKNIQPSNRDMEYHKLMMFISTIIGAVFSIDLAELGIKTDDTTALIGETAEPRIQASKDRGMVSMLKYIEQHINKIIRKVNDEVKFRFIGYEREDEAKLVDVKKKLVESYMTINEIRDNEGLDPLKEDYADIVLNPQSVQLYNAAQMQKQQAEFGGGGGGEEEEGAPAGEEEEEEAGAEVDWEKMFKSLSHGTDKSVKVVIE